MSSISKPGALCVEIVVGYSGPSLPKKNTFPNSRSISSCILSPWL
jgi:hypothetical protein